MIRLTFNGHANFLLEDGTHSILFDPWFTGNPKAKMGYEQVEKLDLILLTHGHADHLGDAVELSKMHKAPIIAPFELAMFCQRRGAAVLPMNHGGKMETDFGLVKMTYAIHSSSFVDRGAEYTGNPCGFVLKTGGVTTYYAGDTALFSDMKLIAGFDPIDVAILPTGDNFTMGSEEAAKAVEFLSPRYAVPMHYGTFEVLEQTPDRFVELLADSATEAAVINVSESREFT